MALSPTASLVPVRLLREGRSQPWGVRLAGGCDLGTPIVVTRAQTGSPAGVALMRGDIIRKIQEFDARDLRHQDALNLFQSAGDSISLVVQRDSNVRRPVQKASLNSTGPLSVSPLPPSRPVSAPGSPLPSFTPPPGHYHSPPGHFHSPSNDDDLVPITKQPYRTTPLVLPGAKVKKEDNVTECYLRHHPNPMMRGHHHHTEYIPADVAMKQKVADTVLQRVIPPDPHRHVVSRPFNTPIGLYSEQNIVDTIHKQHGGMNHVNVANSTPRQGSRVSMKPTVVYDPAKSETYKALQDLELGDTVHEVTVPPQPKVFSPKLHSPTSKVHQKTVATAAHAHLNPMGQPQERIQQSGSFNRLMWMVMNDS